MAGFGTKTFKNHDDYMTPKYVWENIKEFIPKDKIIWEAFYGDGESGKYLTDMGFQTIHRQVDFYDNDLGEIIVSNPPFGDTKRLLPRMKELGKPFILIMPCSKLCTQYFRELFAEVEPPIQIIVPRKRLQFKKLIDGKEPEEGQKNACNFDCFYYCWKINLPRDIIWLE